VVTSPEGWVGAQAYLVLRACETWV
jgi:hypothetical protein